MPLHLKYTEYHERQCHKRPFSKDVFIWPQLRFMTANGKRNKETKCMGGVQKKPGVSFQECSPSESLRTRWTRNGKIFEYPGSLETSVPRDFTGDCSYKLPLPGIYQNSRFPEERQVFRIYYIVCTNSLGTVTHSQGKVHINVRKCLPLKFSHVSQGANLQAGLSKVGRLEPAMLNS